MSARNKTDPVQVPCDVEKAWVIDKKNLLRSYHRSTKQGVFKFCLHVETRAFLLDVRPTTHAGMIQRYGSYVFEEYVRGIYFQDRRTVYFRGHDRKDWLCEAESMLRGHGVPCSTRIIWGPKAARELQNDLWGL